MTTPGTAVVALPTYSTPVFSTPSVKLGDAVTSVKFEGAANVFTFGQAFKVGDIAPTDGLVGRIAGINDIQLQVEVKATHPDGSVRHAIISGVLPTGATGEMFLIRSVKVIAKGVATFPTAYNSHVTVVEAGVEYISTGVSESNITWLSGIVVSEVIRFKPLVNSQGITHPFLTVQYCERAYSTGQVKVDITVEHTSAYKAVGDITYDVKMYIGETVVYSKDALVHFPCTRYKKTFWFGEKPSLHVKHNTPYLLATKAVPNYDQTVVVDEPTLASYATALTQKSFEPMATGRFLAAMGTTGGRPDIGLAPDCHAAYVLSGDKRAKDVMLASADVGGSWSAHRRDIDGKQLDVIHWPRASILGNPGDTLNPQTKGYEKLPNLVTTSKLACDSAHQPAFAYIPYLLTGDYFYLEELQFWCNFNSYVSNPYYRSYEKGLFKTDQIRAQGWSMRTLAQTAYITPDTHYNKMVFKYMLDCNLDWYNTTYTDANPNALGILTNGPAIEYAIKGVPLTGMAPWMDDFFTQAVGCAYELGNTEALRLLKWKAKFQIGRMVDEGYCPTDAAIYALRIRDTSTSALYTTLKQCREGSLDPTKYACDLQADMTGYPTDTEGFPSNYQPALAYAVDSGYDGGDKAWSMFINRKTKPNYGKSPQFAIVPRKAVDIVVVTPPETVPPVVVPPVVIPPVVVVPPVEPPVIMPPVVVPPVVVIPELSITNSVLANETGLSVILVSGVRTLLYKDQTADANGKVVIKDASFVIGVSFECEVLNSFGYTVATAFPIKVS